VRDAPDHPETVYEQQSWLEWVFHALWLRRADMQAAGLSYSFYAHCM